MAAPSQKGPMFNIQTQVRLWKSAQALNWPLQQATVVPSTLLAPQVVQPLQPVPQQLLLPALLHLLSATLSPQFQFLQESSLQTLPPRLVQPRLKPQLHRQLQLKLQLHRRPLQSHPQLLQLSQLHLPLLL